MRQGVLIAWGMMLVLAAASAWAVPHEIAEAPLGNEARAAKALAEIANGPWVAGDWAMKAVVSAGKGRERVSVPMEIVGGWSQVTGRWERIRMSNGRQWLVKGAQKQALWELREEGQGRELSADERLLTIHERMPLSWELYTMGFLNWNSWRYKGVQKSHARWCDCVELTGGAGAAGNSAGSAGPAASTGIYAKAQLWIDVEFGAPLEAQLFDGEGRLLKTVRAVSVQKVDEREWVLKRWEVVDAVTHGKVSVEVVAVALGMRWGNDLWNENSAPAAWPKVPDESWRMLE